MSRIKIIALVATLAIAAGGALVISGCGGGGGGGSTPPTVGTLTGIVRSSANNQVISGATVTIGTGHVTSGFDGSFSIGPLNTGTRTVTVSATGFVSSTFTQQVSEGINAMELDVYLQKAVGSGFAVKGRVTDDLSGQSVWNALITIDSTTARTGLDGRFQVVLPSAPAALTYSCDGTNGSSSDGATLGVGYFSYWAKVNGGSPVDATRITLPFPPTNGMDVGTISLTSKNLPPPPPP